MRGQVQTRGSDAAIAALADAQHGVVARRQLLDAGLSEDSIDRRVAAGRLHQLHRGVYAVGHRVLSLRAHWMAAVLFCGSEAVLSHRSAAALWGIRDYSGAYTDVTSPSKTRSQGRIRRHRALLLPDEVTVHDDIPVTSVPRTSFDLAATTNDPHLVESVVRQSEFLRLSDPLSLWDLVERHPRHRGCRAIRTALARLAEAPGRTRKALEERFLRFLDAYGFPRPHLNAWLEASGQRYQVDCLWPSHRQIVELDSWQAHGTRSAFHSDRTRARHLEAAGYRVTHVTWSHLDQEPAALAADLRTLLA